MSDNDIIAEWLSDLDREGLLDGAQKDRSEYKALAARLQSKLRDAGRKITGDYDL